MVRVKLFGKIQQANAIKCVTFHNSFRFKELDSIPNRGSNVALRTLDEFLVWHLSGNQFLETVSCVAVSIQHGNQHVPPSTNDFQRGGGWGHLEVVVVTNIIFIRVV
ncbi:hypothetical protein E2C01_021052 [Portunus trituberculatus]|uniref:Uncharacterized protein n=1 Tax=Portunus trituberculatus TaxID=210409 RepID=A0A5B7E3D0_PORTR|nr:hypothetical protein [Portunus trituberculatus]